MKKINNIWKFLIIVFVVYVELFIFNRELFDLSIGWFLDISIKIIPVLVFVFVLMSVVNYIITPKMVLSYFSKKGMKKWFFAIVGGILSAGPIYMWYPLLADLREKGVSNGLVACFLYNRAIKIPLIPLAILYFGWKYILVLCVVMMFASVIQGIFVDKFIRGGKK